MARADLFLNVVKAVLLLDLTSIVRALNGFLLRADDQSGTLQRRGSALSVGTTIG